MNERIRELAEQAGLLYPQFGPGVDTRHQRKKRENIEKFAELIVKECVQVGGPEDSYRDDWFNAKVDSVNKIKKHFGVE